MSDATDFAGSPEQCLEELLTWDRNPPDVEWRYGYDEGTKAALHEIADRSEFLRVLAALERSPVAFLLELQRTKFIQDSAARDASPELLEAFLFGAASGGTRGEYGRAYAFAFQAVAPFVRSVH